MRQALAPLAGAGFVVACGTAPVAPVPRAPDPAAAPAQQAALLPPPAVRVPDRLPESAPLRPEPGLYRCELDRTVLLRRVSADGRQLTLQWQGVDQTLGAVDALNGSLRFENPSLGLVWIQIAGKSMLLDSRHGRQLANECRL